MVSHGLTTDQGKQIWQPFLDWIAKSSADYSIAAPPIIGSMPASYWWDPEWRKQHNIGGFVADPRPNARPGDVWWDGDGHQVGWVIYAFESLWMPASLLEESAQAQLVDALFAASRYRGVGLHFNKGLAGAPAEAVAAAATPRPTRPCSTPSHSPSLPPAKTTLTPAFLDAIPISPPRAKGPTPSRNP
jgi:hypothetical protein